MKYIYLLSIAFIISINGNAQLSKDYSLTNPNVSSMDSFINRKADSLLQKQNLTGILVAVSNNGQRSYYSYGYANPATKMAFDSLTILEIGSITKTFTAFVLLKVLHEKKVEESSKIIQYLPDSVQMNTSLSNITFLNLLNHTSGLPRVPDNIEATVINKLQPYENYSEKHLYSYLKKVNIQPTTKSEYSNLGLGLAGVLAVKISGLSYMQLLDKYIHKPLGIRLHNVLTTNEKTNKAIGSFGQEIAAYWNMAILAPAGGIKYNAASMLSYLQHICKPSDENKEIVDSLTAVTVAINANINIGRAWHTYERKNKPTIYWHNGGTYGFSTFCGFVKGTNKMVFIAINEFNKNSISDGLGIAILSKLIQ